MVRIWFPRFSLRQMMIAVALSPIVIFSGMKASEIRGTTDTIIQSSRVKINAVTYESSMTLEETFSIWPGIFAAAGTTLLLGLIWFFVARGAQPFGKRKQIPLSELD